MSRRTLLWVAAALLGIAATATVAWSASRLAATRIGLAGDPVSVTSGLAPANTAATPTHVRTPARPSAKPQHRQAHRTPPRARSSTASAATVVPVTPAPSIVRTVVATPPVTAAPPAATTTASTPAPAPRRPTTHRDDSVGDGSGNSNHGRDD